MSVDIVDDLEYAEELIGQMLEALHDHGELSFDDYCRPTCQQEKDYADEDAEFVHDDCCGCPCHNDDADHLANMAFGPIGGES